MSGSKKGKPGVAILAISFASVVMQSSGLADERLNILYVNTDQWRASAMGYMGDPNVKTPNIDKFAKESLHFKNAVSVIPVCTPHRAALMTGRYPTSTGMFLNDAHLPEEELCMAEIFKPAGYTTGFIGKWHLDGRGRRAYIPPERRQGWEYWKGAECDHNYLKSHYYTGESSEIQYWPGYDAYAQTADAQQYLKDHAKGDKPFVLMLAFGTPHFPHHTAPEEYKKMYPVESIKLPPNVPQEMQEKAKKEAQGYYAHCTALDKCLGDLLETLKETGLDSKTIVVFSSDHGEALGSHGVPATQKQVAWSEAAQVPFLIRVPGVKAREVATPISTPDVLPTLLGLTKVEVPKSVEGEDLSASIKEGKDIDRVALYMSVWPFAMVAKDKIQEYRAILTQRYTYVRSQAGPLLMYDNQVDKYQMDNLVGKAGAEEQVKEMEARLQNELKRVKDDFRPGEEYLKEWGYEGIKPGQSIGYSDNGDKPVQTPKRK